MSDDCLRGRNMLGEMVSCQRRHVCADTIALAAQEPLGVDLSDYADDAVAGFLAGQANALEWLDEERHSAPVTARYAALEALEAVALALDEQMAAQATTDPEEDAAVGNAFHAALAASLATRPKEGGVMRWPWRRRDDRKEEGPHVHSVEKGCPPKLLLSAGPYEQEMCRCATRPKGDESD